MLRIVIDTNVTVSALIHKKFAAEVFDDSVANHIVFTSDWMVRELEATLKNKFKVTDKDCVAIITFVVNRFISLTPNTTLPNICTDSDDNNVLQLCESANADILITGDRALLELSSFKNTRIVTPRMYYDTIHHTSIS